MAHIAKVRMTFVEDVLGTSPSDPDVYRKFIAERAEDSIVGGSVTPDGADVAVVAAEAKAQQEVENAENAADSVDDDGSNQGVTVFPRDSDGNPFVYDYQVKGFLKDACGSLRRIPKTFCAGVRAYKKIIDGTIFPLTRTIPIMGEGSKPLDVSICSRPLRATTAQGDRVAIATSECIPEGSYIEFPIAALDGNDGMRLIEECLTYGRFRGFGQWRNSGKGRFTWELLEFDGKPCKPGTTITRAMKDVGAYGIPTVDILTNPKYTIGI